ncbi:MAG TPA: DEAD/DEAH box helicase [Alphaproteobacteria bacterium]|nr:DEAD/DEAH box helicase [Alphaproteobacteria bacterium]
MPFPAVDSALARALADQGYAEPTPVQAAVLQPEVAGRDLLVSAQTGSGKTVAYALAAAQTLIDDGLIKADAPVEPLVLIVAPTRELALQVHRELSWLYQHLNLRLATCVGGMDVRREQRALSFGVHVVVGTPGRLCDHLKRGNLETGSMRVVVLDEADEMLDLGFREDLEFLLDATPEGRRTLLFSATIPRDIAALAKKFQRDAERIITASEKSAHADIDYKAIRIAPNEAEHAAVNVLRFFEARGAMIFCGTRDGVRHMHASLQERGFAAVALSGELSQNERTHALQSLRDGRARVCVATDVAARGIDLPDLGLVIHADLPNNKETLLHRSGRTGRAGRKGTCVILVPYNRRRKAEGMLHMANLKVDWIEPPTAEQIREQDQARLLAELKSAEEVTPDETAAAQALLAEMSAEDLAVAYLRLHRAHLPAPEDLFQGGQSNEGGRERDRESNKRERSDFDASPWFTMNIGRDNNADPRWLLPLICRRGHVTKRDIGAIRIFEGETRFQITDAAAEKFFTAASRPDEKDEGILFERAAAPSEAELQARAPRSEGGYKGKRPFKSREEGGFERRPRRNEAGRNEAGRREGSADGYVPGDYKGGNNYGKGRERAERSERSYERREPAASAPSDSAPATKTERTAFAPREDRPFKKPYEKKSFGEKTFGGEKKPFGDKKPYSDKKPYEKKSFGEKKAYGDKPYAKRDDKKPYGEKKPYLKREGGYAGREEGPAKPPRAKLGLNFDKPNEGGDSAPRKSFGGKPFLGKNRVEKSFVGQARRKPGKKKPD